MKIFEPVSCHRESFKPGEVVPAFLGRVYPGHRLIGMVQEGEPICQLFQSGNRLMEFQCYFRGVTEDFFERLLHSAAKLEAKRKELHNDTMQEIGICILASGYEPSLLTRISYGIVHLRLFEYVFMKSDGEEGMMVREVKKNLARNAVVENFIPQAPESGISETKHSDEFDLSTPELIAFTRLGMEIRHRRLNQEHLQA